MKRRIHYIPKVTASRANYREISDEDMSWLKEELIRWMATMGELDQFHDVDAKWVRDSYWHKRTDTLPRGKFGNNSPCSFVSGLLNNLVFGQQKDLSDKQMDAIQNISHIVGAATDTCTEITFQVGF